MASGAAVVTAPQRVAKMKRRHTTAPLALLSLRGSLGCYILDAFVKLLGSLAN